MSEVSERIEELSKKRHLSRAELSRGTGIPESSIRSWALITSPSADAIYKVASFFNVSMEYILTGKNFDERDSDEIELISLFNKLDQRDKSDVLDILRVKASHYSNAQEKNTSAG